MARPTYPSDKQDQFMLRFPDGMRDSLKEIAVMEGRSLNAEIIDRLTTSMQWPQIALPQELHAAVVEALPVGILDTLQDEINSFAIDRVTKALKNHELSQLNLVSRFQEILEYVPETDRNRIKEEMNNLLRVAGIKIELR